MGFNGQVTTEVSHVDSSQFDLRTELISRPNFPSSFTVRKSSHIPRQESNVLVNLFTKT